MMVVTLENTKNSPTRRLCSIILRSLQTCIADPQEREQRPRSKKKQDKQEKPSESFPYSRLTHTHTHISRDLSPLLPEPSIHDLARSSRPHGLPNVSGTRSLAGVWRQGKEHPKSPPLHRSSNLHGLESESSSRVPFFCFEASRPVAGQVSESAQHPGGRRAKASGREEGEG